MDPRGRSIAQDDVSPVAPVVLNAQTSAFTAFGAATATAAVNISSTACSIVAAPFAVLAPAWEEAESEAESEALPCPQEKLLKV